MHNLYISKDIANDPVSQCAYIVDMFHSLKKQVGIMCAGFGLFELGISSVRQCLKAGSAL